MDGCHRPGALVATGEVAPSELLQAAIERIEQSNPSLNAVVIEWFDHGRCVAADPELPDGPFRGVPFLLKDLYSSFAGRTLSNGNRALKEAGKIDPADTTLVARFKAAGLVIAGRTNSPEMDSLPTTQPVAWGATRNPWAVQRTPGGSSGGAAAAVAAGMVPFAHASDGGTVNLSNPTAIFAGSPSRFSRSRVTYEAYVVSGTSTRPQVDSAISIPGKRILIELACRLRCWPADSRSKLAADVVVELGGYAAGIGLGLLKLTVPRR